MQAQSHEEQGAARKGQLMLADPFILEDDGWFYIYGTQAEDGIVVYRSRDLKHWSDRCGNARNSLPCTRMMCGETFISGRPRSTRLPMDAI